MLEDCGWDVDQAINDLKEEELGRRDILRRLQEQLARSRVVSGRLAEVVRSPMIFTHGWSCRCWKIQTLYLTKVLNGKLILSVPDTDLCDIQ